MTELSPTTSSSVAKRLISQAAILGERGVAVTRLVLAVLMLPSTLLFHDRHGQLFHQPEIISAMLGYGVGIGFSIWTLTTLRSHHSLLLRLRLSVVVDALMLTLILLPLHIWTTESYEGFLRSPNAGIVAVATIATGLRLSRSVALLGSTLFLILQGITIAIDLTYNSARVTFEVVEHVVNATVYLLGAATLAYTIAIWSRKLIYRASRAERQAERLRQSYDLMVAMKQDENASQTRAAATEGQRKTVGVVVCSVYGFRTRTGEIPAGQMIAEMNVYFDAVAAAVKEHGGIVDKFFSETVVALFGLPKPRPDDAVRTVFCARAIQEALVQINQRRKEANLSPLSHSVAVHYGDVAVGNIGSRGRRQYSTAGEVLSTAVDLCGHAERATIAILVSGAAFGAAQAVDPKIPLVQLKDPGLAGTKGQIYSFSQLSMDNLSTARRPRWSAT